MNAAWEAPQPALNSGLLSVGCLLTYISALCALLQLTRGVAHRLRQQTPYKFWLGEIGKFACCSLSLSSCLIFDCALTSILVLVAYALCCRFHVTFEPEVFA